MHRSYILDLVLVEVRYLVDEKPRQGTAKVYDFVHDEGHDSSGEYIVLHKGIPGRPETLKDVEMDIVLGNLVELAPIGIRCDVEKRRGGVPCELRLVS